MNWNYKFEKIIFDDGEIFFRPRIIFEDVTLNKTNLGQFLYEYDNDLLEKELIHFLNKEFDQLVFQENVENGNFGLCTDSVDLEIINSQATIKGLFSDEKELDSNEPISITLSFDILVKILQEYRKRAKEFRENLKNSEKK